MIIRLNIKLSFKKPINKLMIFNFNFCTLKKTEGNKFVSIIFMFQSIILGAFLELYIPSYLISLENKYLHHIQYLSWIRNSNIFEITLIHSAKSWTSISTSTLLQYLLNSPKGAPHILSFSFSLHFPLPPLFVSHFSRKHLWIYFEC